MLCTELTAHCSCQRLSAYAPQAHPLELCPGKTLIYIFLLEDCNFICTLGTLHLFLFITADLLCSTALLLTVVKLNLFEG